jgi:phage tail-like protein
MAFKTSPGEDMLTPFGNFAFHVVFEGVSGSFVPGGGVSEALLGGFSEISGLEATMEHKVIKAGGRNYGAVMRAGPVSFGTVVMKRGIVSSAHLWRWWSMFAGSDGASDGRPVQANRSNVLIGLMSTVGSDPTNKDPKKRSEPMARLGWRLKNAMPVKFRVADFNAKGNDVAVEELHLVHEGLEMKGVIG